MKTPSLLHPLQALRGLRTLALAAITVTLLGAESALASVTYGNVTPLPTDSNHGSDYLLGSQITVTTAGTLDAFGVEFRATGGQASFGLYAADGGGGEPGTLVAQTGAFPISATGVVEVPPTAAAALTPGDYWIMAVYTNSGTSVGANYSAGSAVVKYRDLSFTGNLPASFGPAITYTGQTFNYYIRVSTGPHAVLYTKGGAVPGVSGATFTGFGTPSINESGTVAFLGKWTGTSGNGTGIFAAGALVVKVGDEVVPASGVKIKSMKDPVLDDMGRVAFPAALIGTGISSANDSAIISNAPGGTLAIIAQEGTQAADAPAGALWKSFTSTAAPGGGGGVLILGFMAEGPGGITAANDNGLWSADGTGALHLMLQEGTTAIGAKTVKSFAVLKALSGTPGQTHAHNTNAELVSKVTFTDGFQALVHTALP